MKRLAPLTLIIALAACGGGGGDVNVSLPTTNGAPTAPGTPAPTSPPGGAAWPVPSYEFWLATTVGQPLGTATVAPDRTLAVSNQLLRFTAPYTSGCAIDGGVCVESLSAAVVEACPQNQPRVVLVDSRSETVSNLAVIEGMTFKGMWFCNPDYTGFASVSAGRLTIRDAQVTYLNSPLADLVANGRIAVRRVGTGSGSRYVLVERDTSQDWVAYYVQQ
jgi:hypothetical protein